MARITTAAAAICGIGLGAHITVPLYGAPAVLVALIIFAVKTADSGAARFITFVRLGCVILAVAVLSILLTAPLGAIGIMIFGERILDRGERSAYSFKQLHEGLGLPHVGQRVRSRVFGTIWKIIEEKEVWLKSNPAIDSPGQDKALQPAIHLRYWKEDPGAAPGKGKVMVYRYSRQDPTFNNHWEVLYDW